MRSVLVGYGHALPDNVVTNDDLAKKIDTNHEWIFSRTGIAQRHIAAPGENTSHLAIRAGKSALENAGLKPSDIDTLIVATTTPDDSMPSTAARVQAGIGMESGAAFDVNAACSGFVYGLHVADSLMKTGASKRVMVIGADTFSRILNWEDRTTCVLFGDGAGAFILEASEQPGDRGILHTQIGSDGRLAGILGTSGGVSSTMTAGHVFMNGKEVFRHAVARMGGALLESLEKLGLSKEDLKVAIPHQANWRIMRAIAQHTGLPEEKIVSTVEKHANTSAASIPLAFAVAAAEKRISQGDLIAFPALGAGLTWGCCIIRW